MQVRALFVFLSILIVVCFATAQISSDASMPNPSPGAASGVMPNGLAPAGTLADKMGSVGSISGSVLTVDGRPLRDTQVALHDLSTGSVVAMDYTKVNGSFNFNNVPYGQYEVVANKGVDSAQQRIHVDFAPADVTLRVNAPQAAPGSGNTVSVTALRVPDKAQDEYRKAKEAFDKRKFDEAQSHIDKALTILPMYAQALTVRGLLKVNRGDLPGGQQDFQSAISADPNFALGYFAMGAALNSSGQFPGAQRAIEQGLRIEPASWQGYFELSKSVLGQHDFRNALKYIVKAESFGAAYPPIHLVKAHALLGLKDYDGAASELEQYLSAGAQGPQADEARRALNEAKAFSTTARK